MKEKILSFYSKNKKIVWIVGVILVVVLGFTLLTGNDSGDNWDDLLLGSHLPENKKGTIDTGSNLDDYLSFSIENVKKSYYNEYKKACIDMGYTIESEESGDRYEAYNEDGYELSIYYSSDDIHVTLQAPEEMSEITWPTSGLGAKLPTPTSTYGKVTSDSSNAYIVLLGKTTLDDYNKYVSACQEKGFNVDYNKQETIFSAKDKEGYRLSVSYSGNSIMDVMIQIPSEDSNSNNNDSEMVDGMRKEFKDAMDSYDEFMDEYVTFMKKYKANPSDSSLLSDYSNYLSKYSDFVSDFEKWDGNNLNTKEAAYYLEVQTRVNKKLLEVAS